MSYSGKIYAIPLDFGYGFLFAEISDFSEISEFDGILAKVYNYRVNELSVDIPIDDIVSSGLLLFPMPMGKYPATRGKYAWKLWGENPAHDYTPPIFKSYRGVLKAKNWSALTPWFKQSPFTENFYDEKCVYDEVRHLETMKLNHQDLIKIKCTMRLFINDGKAVSNFYNLAEMGYRNMYVQVVNTYYDLEKANELLTVVDDLL